MFPETRPDELVQTRVDLLSQLTAGKSYILSIKLLEPTDGAKPVEYPAWMSASREPLASWRT